MEFQTAKSGEKRVLFDADSDAGKRIAEKLVPPEDEQEPNESRRQWERLTKAILAKNMSEAADAKGDVEDAQREDRRIRDEKGEVFVPRFFELRDGRWEPKFTCVPVFSQLVVISSLLKHIACLCYRIPTNVSTEEATKAVKEWIWPSPTPTTTAA